MDVWTSQSNSGKQTMLSVACAAVGLILVISFRDFRGFGTNTMAGFLLGLLLLLIGVAGFLVSGKQTVIVDPKARRITIEDSNRFHTRKRLIPFEGNKGT
jgi:thiamine transporter ThiT